MSRLPDVDLLAGLGAGGLAVAAALVPELAGIIAPPQTLGAFALAALGRWYARARKAQAPEELEAP